MNKKTIMTAVAVTVIGAGMLSASNAFAQSNKDNQDPMSTLVQKIATKFNLQESEVQAVFDEAHEERHTEMQARFEEQLSQYVKDGKITEQQKQLILEKRKALEANREEKMDAFKNLSDGERKTKMDQERTELEAWAKENGIDLKYLMPRDGKGPGMKMIFRSHDGTQSATATPTTAQ